MIPWTLNAIGWGALSVVWLTGAIQNASKPDHAVSCGAAFVICFCVFLGSVYMLGYCDRKKP